MNTFTAWNAPMPTTAAILYVGTGTSIKTMLQIATPSTRQFQLVSWGFSVDAKQGGRIELLQTDVAATVTAHVASGVQSADPNGPPSLATLGIAATGYTASAEGAITVTRNFDSPQLQGGGNSDNNYEKVWMPDARPIIAVSKFIRVRVTFGTGCNMLTWVTWIE